MIRHFGTTALLWGMALGACSIDSRNVTTAEPGPLFDRAATGAGTGTTDRATAEEMSSSSAGSAGLAVTDAGLARSALQAPGALDFGSVTLPNSASRTLALQNVGDAPNAQIVASISGAAAADFIVQRNGCTAGLARQASCSLPVAFTPSVGGSRRATLTLAGMSGGTLDVALSGFGLDPGSLTLAPAAGGAAYFGEGVIGSSASQLVTQTFVVANQAPVASGILSISPPQANFRISDPTGSDCVSNTTSLEPNTSCTLQVAFVPTERGTVSADLTVSSVASGGATITLSGMGFTPAQLYTSVAALVLNPSPGQAAQGRLYVGNAGDQTSGALSASISAGSSEFSVAPATCTGELVSGGSCAFDISFTPSASGSGTATLHVMSDPGGAIDVPVEADGQAPATIKLTGDHGTDFGLVDVNSSKTLSFTIAASGNQSSGALQAITLGPNFTLAPPASGDCVPSSLSFTAGSSCALRVVFQPTAPGIYGTMLVATSALGGSTSLALTGKAQ